MAKYTQEYDDGRGHKVTKTSHKSMFWAWIGFLIVVVVCVDHPIFIIPTVILMALFIIGKNKENRDKNA